MASMLSTRRADFLLFCFTRSLAALHFLTTPRMASTGFKNWDIPTICAGPLILDNVECQRDQGRKLLHLIHARIC